MNTTSAAPALSEVPSKDLSDKEVAELLIQFRESVLEAHFKGHMHLPKKATELLENSKADSIPDDVMDLIVRIPSTSMEVQRFLLAEKTAHRKFLERGIADIHRRGEIEVVAVRANSCRA